MGTDNWWDSPGGRWEAGTRWLPQGHGKWTRGRGSWADQWEEEGHDAEHASAPPAASRRRLDGDGNTPGGGDGHRQPQQPQPQQQPQAVETGGPTGEQAAAADAARQKQLHGERVNHIINMAINAGINPVTASGEELQLLDPHQLDAWVAEHFTAALLC
jgi:hypothetical protein